MKRLFLLLCVVSSMPLCVNAQEVEKTGNAESIEKTDKAENAEKEERPSFGRRLTKYVSVPKFGGYFIGKYKQYDFS